MANKEKVAQMKLTPMDIHNKQFKTKVRGYDEVQVDKFLDEIIDAYSDALDQITDLQRELAQANRRLSTGIGATSVEPQAIVDDPSAEVNELLLSAQKSAMLITKNAHAEADKILADANTEADKILSEASDDSKKAEVSQDIYEMNRNLAVLTEDYDRLKGKVGDFREKSRMLLEKELEQLDDENWQYWLDKYYDTPRIYPADSEPINSDQLVSEPVPEELLVDNQPGDTVEFQGDPNQMETSDLDESHIDQKIEVKTDQGPFIIFPEDYKDHN